MSSSSKVLTASAGLMMAAALLVAAPSAPATAGHGTSTSGAILTAVNPASALRQGDAHVALTAHALKSALDDAACRPHDSTLDCWGSLVLRIPAAGGLSVSDFEVHRVAVGDVACGDDGDDSCGGHEAAMTSTIGGPAPVQAMVNGVAVLRDPGSTGEPRGSTVQLKIHLTDNGEALYADQIDVQVNKFVPGPVKPELYRTGPQTIQQVRIHLDD